MTENNYLYLIAVSPRFANSYILQLIDANQLFLDEIDYLFKPLQIGYRVVIVYLDEQQGNSSDKYLAEFYDEAEARTNQAATIQLPSNFNENQTKRIKKSEKEEQKLSGFIQQIKKGQQKLEDAINQNQWQSYIEIGSCQNSQMEDIQNFMFKNNSENGQQNQIISQSLSQSQSQISLLQIDYFLLQLYRDLSQINDAIISQSLSQSQCQISLLQIDYFLLQLYRDLSQINEAI